MPPEQPTFGLRLTKQLKKKKKNIPIGHNRFLFKCSNTSLEHTSRDGNELLAQVNVRSSECSFK